MNGTESKIEIFKPFGEAWELMQVTLFRPFDFSKWLIIGFAAFLSGHFAAGGFNFPIRNFRAHEQNTNLASSFPDQWKPWLPVGIALFVVLIIVLFLLFLWIKARGSFVFTDCVVQNRAAIVQPWREYRREGNSYFLFLMAIAFASMAVFGLLALLVVVPLGIFGHGRSTAEMTPLVAVSIALLLVAWICWTIFFGIVNHFMVPVMYRQRCQAIEAFRNVVSLAVDHAGSFVLFCLFGICLLLAMIVIGAIVTCLTCCLAALPYVGTVIMLPVFVCLRAFSLCFLRQFGPEYDVWASQPETPPPLPTTTA
jgi:hypothetical protein